MTYKINLHCHTQYSDGFESSSVMLLEHKKRKFSCFVTTDHLYPRHHKDRYSMNSAKFKMQRRELHSISEYINFPFFQGIELCLYGEEILVFGNQTIYDIFKFVDTTRLKSGVYLALLDIIERHRKYNAIILCHPSLNEDSKSRQLQERLFPLLDGYERENKGIDMFKHREIPEELKSKHAFYNSDAHWLADVKNCKNQFDHLPKDEDDLVQIIKRGPNVGDV